jgi:hypothetical protein
VTSGVESTGRHSAQLTRVLMKCVPRLPVTLGKLAAAAGASSLRRTNQNNSRGREIKVDQSLLEYVGRPGTSSRFVPLRK